MSYVKGFQCIECGKKYSGFEPRFKCRCGGSLDIIYDYPYIMEKIFLSENTFRRTHPTHWKYWPFYPIYNISKAVSMQEGGTALLSSKKNKNLYFKNETTNPTGSFKDRGSSIELTKAIELRAKKIYCASTGNMGASIAAYGARAGVNVRIYLPDVATSNKIEQIHAYGAEIKKVDGDYTKAMRLAEKESVNDGAFLTGDYPYRGEGSKSIGYEIADQMQWTSPDYIFCPIGNGTLLVSLWKAFKELQIVGLIQELPKIVGIQTTGCKPIIKALQGNTEKIKPIIPNTICSAIACGDPIQGIMAIRAIKESKGFGVVVSDDEAMAARKELGKEGLYVEPSGALAYAGFLKSNFNKEKCVALLTGHGLKGI